MPPKFGTSGLRGLVAELTPELVTDHVTAFLVACPQGEAVHVGRDLRPSSPQIAETVIAAVRAAGRVAVDTGALPTPALALDAMAAGNGAVMVTGSHIPADRNGLKFYAPLGEISKAEEAAIAAALGAPAYAPGAEGPLRGGTQAAARYAARYVEAFGPRALTGLRLGVYEHSSVARDLMHGILRQLGAETVALARSERFVPVDTEAVDPETRARLAGWCAAHRLDAILSTDGDADRPMLTDDTGRVIPGDVLGALTARMLGARHVCTPVSSNSLIRQLPEVATVVQTRIGSPFVITAMETALTEAPGAPVAGYEANGGFLLGFTAQGPAGPLEPLMTRDSLLPMLAPLAAACAAGRGLASLVATLPPRFTATGRIRDVATNRTTSLITTLSADPGARAAFFDTGADETGIDLTDGLRVRFANDAVVHLRPSGNAPECRCYTEAGDSRTAERLAAAHLDRLAAWLT